MLADEDSPAFIPNAWSVPASMWFGEHKAVEAFRTGQGIPWGDHNGRLHCGAAAFYRTAYRASLVADAGCGHGHSTMFMAIAFTGNADVDFVRGMIPHHQGAIDMAQVVLEHGRNEATRKWANDIIREQEREIAEMREWLTRNAR